MKGVSKVSVGVEAQTGDALVAGFELHQHFGQFGVAGRAGDQTHMGARSKIFSPSCCATQPRRRKPYPCRIALETLQAIEDLLFGFITNAAGVVENVLRGFERLDLGIAFVEQRADDLFRIMGIHLAAESLDVKVFSTGVFIVAGNEEGAVFILPRGEFGEAFEGSAINRQRRCKTPRGFARHGNNAPRTRAGFNLGKQVGLIVEPANDEIPGSGLNKVTTGCQVRLNRIHALKLDRFDIDSSDAPATLGQPKRITPFPEAADQGRHRAAWRLRPPL